MVIRKKQKLWIDKIKKNHTCFAKMLKPLSSLASQESYAYKIQRFMGFALDKKYVKHNEDFESLLKYDAEKITDILEDFVNYLENDGILSDSIPSILTPIELFFEMNRKIWHKKIVRRSIQKVDRVLGGDSPATNDDLLMMLSYCMRSLRSQALILFLASTGIRPAAIIDPVLRMRHLVWMPNLDNPNRDNQYCYAVKIYEKSKEEYWVFLTPEASKILVRYIDGRKKSGENITQESPIFVSNNTRWNSKYEYLTDDNLNAIISKIIEKSKIPRIKQGYSYNKSRIYMFRKRFNTILKLTNGLNSNIAEKLMAHKRGLDGVYLKPTREECYVEFFKAIPNLTINDSERQKIEIEKKQKKIDELEEKTATINEQSKDMKSIQEQLLSLQKKQAEQDLFLELLEKYPQTQE